MPEKFPALAKVHLGRPDASDEATIDPELLLNGYLDYRESVYKMSSGLAWYILGPKGAGKSAVFEHIRLKWNDRHDRFFVAWDLRGFPVADVTQIQTGQTPGSSRTQSAWEFLLLLRVIQSLSKDQSLEAPDEFRALLRELIKAGLLVDDWKPSVSRWSSSKASFKLALGPFGIDLVNTPVGPLEVAAVLRSALETVRTTHRHILSVDGLDSFFLETSDDWASLAGLVHAIESVNRFLAGLNLPVSVVAAVRTEAFEALESTDSNKLKPHTVYLDWSPSGMGLDSKLWSLIDTKVRVSQPSIKSFAATYLTADIGQGPFRQIPEYFLSNTRLLPRDLIALLTCLQEVHPGFGPVTERQAVRAVHLYSEQYFVGEMRNNLTGILSDQVGRQEKTNAFFEALKGVKLAEFKFAEIQEELEGEVTEAETKRLLRQLFTIGGIGIRTRTDGGTERTDFIFRKSSPVAFNARRNFLLHNALIVAWNKPRY